jgi:hypothetical protein
MQMVLDEQHAKLVVVHRPSMTSVPWDIAEFADVITQDDAHGVGAWVKASPWALDVW